MARIDGASQTGCWHGSDGRSMHDIDASPPWRQHPLARLIDCVYDCDGMPSNGKNTTIRGVRWAPVMPTARPHNVGPCAARASCQKIDPANELHAGGEVCPGFPRPHSYGHRCTRALAVRPLQAPRAWSSRFDCRQWRRRSVTSGSEKSAGRCERFATWFTSVNHIGLGVNNIFNKNTSPEKCVLVRD